MGVPAGAYVQQRYLNSIKTQQLLKSCSWCFKSYYFAKSFLWLSGFLRSPSTWVEHPVELNYPKHWNIKPPHRHVFYPLVLVNTLWTLCLHIFYLLPHPSFTVLGQTSKSASAFKSFSSTPCRSTPSHVSHRGATFGPPVGSGVPTRWNSSTLLEYRNERTTKSVLTRFASIIISTTCEQPPFGSGSF